MKLRRGDEQTSVDLIYRDFTSEHKHTVSSATVPQKQPNNEMISLIPSQVNSFNEFLDHGRDKQTQSPLKQLSSARLLRTETKHEFEVSHTSQSAVKLVAKTQIVVDAPVADTETRRYVTDTDRTPKITFARFKVNSRKFLQSRDSSSRKKINVCVRPGSSSEGNKVVSSDREQHSPPKSISAKTGWYPPPNDNGKLFGRVPSASRDYVDVFDKNRFYNFYLTNITNDDQNRDMSPSQALEKRE